jgi:hypothetical protein
VKCIDLTRTSTGAGEAASSPRGAGGDSDDSSGAPLRSTQTLLPSTVTCGDVRRGPGAPRARRPAHWHPAPAAALSGSGLRHWHCHRARAPRGRRLCRVHRDQPAAVRCKAHPGHVPCSGSHNAYHRVSLRHRPAPGRTRSRWRPPTGRDSPGSAANSDSESQDS